MGADLHQDHRDAERSHRIWVRHAFDADHIAAIDNTTRKIAVHGNESASVGFWFALGYSTVVTVAVSLLAEGLNELAESLS